MATIKEYLENARNVREMIPDIIDGIIFENETLILDMNRQQMTDGQNNEGKEIRPLYSEDPYFKTAQSAQAYIRWKQIITPNTKRNPDVPNLFIDGTFHRSLQLVRVGPKIMIKGNASFADNIDAKYNDVLGLAPYNQERLNNEYIHPKLMQAIKQYL